MRIARVTTAAAAGLLLSSALLAQQARVFGQVTDPDGNPIADVKVHVGSPDSDFDLDTLTDKRGNYRVNVIDATKHFDFRFQKEGFLTHEENGVKLPVGLNERRDVQLTPGVDAPPAGAPNPAIAVFNDGAEAFSQGDTVVAREKFEEAIGLDPTLAEPHAAIARLELDEKQYAAAAAAAEAALAIEPGQALALRVAIAAYTELGDEKKLAAAQAALAAADPSAAAEQLYVDGARLYNEGKTAEAAEILAQAVEADPDHAKSHNLLGTCYISLGKMAEAKQHLETFLRLAPNDPDAPAAREMLKYLN